MTKPALDFTRIEALRKHMLLSVLDLCNLFGVSRPTYYGWLKGKPVRVKNDERIRVVLKKLLAVMADHGWPMPEIIAAKQPERFERLKSILEAYEHQ